MRVFKAGEFKGSKPWDSELVQQFNGATVKIHWTDKPYIWHINDGPEVFTVLSGTVDMRIRKNGKEEVFEPNAGDIAHMEAGDEHVAHPRGPATILVVETLPAQFN